ncbi:HlyD family type I secretion periplasmic adaptor subunit [Modicisalibacter luteus]|uniref:HlyD family type I secretion periplasmic adaptor subunit n=1 Tax=Modicisalibacter luteus TaxID=453962 RepID=UPI0036360352
MLTCFVGFGSWAVAANLAVAVVAPGTVSVASFKKTVQHYEGGIVSNILVDDGDHVDAGDPLLVLDNTQALSKLEIARSQYLINRATEVRLLAEQAGKPTLTFPEKLREYESERVGNILEVQRDLFQARRQTLQGALDTLDQQTVQLREQIEGLRQVMAVNRKRVDSLRQEAKDFRSLYKEGLGNNQRVRELERQILQYQGEIAQHQADIARLESQISENGLKRRVRQQEFQQELGEQLRQVQADIADAEERMTALSDQVRRTTVTAPVSGTVVGLAVRTQGAVVAPGDPIMDIVPSNDSFIIETRIADRDIETVYPGQRAEIRFSAFNQRLANVVEGKSCRSLPIASSTSPQAPGTTRRVSRLPRTASAR